MVYNAIAQSAQPIISYNFGLKDEERVAKAFRLSMQTALVCGVGFFMVTLLFSKQIVALFIDSGYPAHSIAVAGLPYFAFGYIFFAFNIIGIGYYQSVERPKRATVITLMRGVVFMLICFAVLPQLFGVKGIWFAVPLAEILTLLFIGVVYTRDRIRCKTV